MQVQQQVDLGDQRFDLAGAVELDRTALAVQRIGAPDAVHVLVDEARGDRLLGIEAQIGRHVAEDHGKPAPDRTELLAQQQVQRMGAADLVAVDQRGDADMRPRPPRIEMMGVGHACIALAVLLDGNGQKGIGRQGSHHLSGSGIGRSVYNPAAPKNPGRRQRNYQPAARRSAGGLSATMPRISLRVMTPVTGSSAVSYALAGLRQAEAAQLAALKAVGSGSLNPDVMAHAAAILQSAQGQGGASLLALQASLQQQRYFIDILA